MARQFMTGAFSPSTPSRRKSNASYSPTDHARGNCQTIDRQNAERKKLDPDWIKTYLEPLQAEAKERQKAAGSEGKTGGRGNKKPLGNKLPKGSEKRTKAATVPGWDS